MPSLVLESYQPSISIFAPLLTWALLGSGTLVKVHSNFVGLSHSLCTCVPYACICINHVVYNSMGYRETVKNVADHSMKSAVEEVSGGEVRSVCLSTYGS